jgi:hypothetical protein
MEVGGQRHAPAALPLGAEKSRPHQDSIPGPSSP